MLIEEDLKWNYRIFRLAAKVGYYPVNLVKTPLGLRMEYENRIWRWVIFFLWYLSLISIALYLDLRTLFFYSEIDLQFTGILLVMCAAYTMFSSVVLLFFVKEGRLNTVVFNEMNKLRADALAICTANKIEPKKSLLETLFCYFFATFYSMLVMYPIMYAVNLDIPILIISCFPVEWRNPFTVGICLVTDVLLQGLMQTNCLYSFHMTFTFVSSFTEYTKLVTNELSESPKALWPSIIRQVLESCRHLRRLRVQLRYFNKVYSIYLYLMKLYLMFVTIVGGFLVIRLGRENPVSVIYGLFFINAVAMYAGIFQTAFGVTSCMDDFKTQILVKTGRMKIPNRRKECERVFWSVPTMAMKVGGFYDVEQDSVLQYINFVVDQIVGLLVSFP